MVFDKLLEKIEKLSIIVVIQWVKEHSIMSNNSFIDPLDMSEQLLIDLLQACLDDKEIKKLTSELVSENYRIAQARIRKAIFKAICRIWNTSDRCLERWDGSRI